ncbi:elongation factor-like GTPase 1, partial [Tanacetum coccineum]
MLGKNTVKDFDENTLFAPYTKQEWRSYQEKKMNEETYKINQLRPGAFGLNLTVKVVDSMAIQTRGGRNGTQGRNTRLAECLVGDETGVVVFTAINEQGMLIELEKIIKLNPLEAYAKLLRIVHEVKGIVSAYKSDKYLSDVDSIIQSGTGEMGHEGIEFIEDDEEDTFQPQKGNVVFACALDGWGFGICEFADFYASKLGASAGTLQKALCGP